MVVRRSRARGTLTERTAMMASHITVCRLGGTDDTLVKVPHADGEYVTFRVASDSTVGQFTTYDVSPCYADRGHDVHEDRAVAKDCIRLCEDRAAARLARMAR